MKNHLLLLIILLSVSINLYAQSIHDDFEGSGTITTWAGDNCNINISLINPQQTGINTSATVLEYHDVGGQYANIRFDKGSNFDLSTDYTFSLKIYVPSSGITGNSTNQISLKLQDGTLGSPWTTQSEVIKPIALDQWQTITFDFLNDTYINLDGASPPPTQRTDFNRVLLQVNGENNNDYVKAYIDDFTYGSSANTPTNYTLVWSDEFDVNGAADASKWHHQTQLPAGGSWYNNEIQHYTDRTDNTIVGNGNLNIIAKKETFTDQGYTKQYTSARLNSKVAFQYGKVEVKAKLPTGVGTWPAIWMLGKNINEDGGYWDNQGYGTASWPACGEIDIMEHWGHNQNYISSAMHTTSSSGATINHGGQTISTASTDFHVYAIEWTSEKIVFSVDGVVHYTYNPAVKDAATWPFDAEQYILLNIAIEPSIAATYTQDTMEIDYVRVYQDLSAAPTTPTAAPNPIHDEVAADVISIFSDSYSNVAGTDFDPNWTQGTNATIEIIDGNETLKYDNLDYQGTEYPAQDASALTHLHIDFWTANSTTLDFYLISQTPTVDTDFYSLNISGTEQWISIDIPLSSFQNVDMTDIWQFKVVGDGTVYFDNLYFHNGTVTPVELTYFNAKAEGNQNILSWQTENELNNSHFEIERSTNGIDFEMIGTIEGQGTTFDVTNYDFIDKNSEINTYYRLRQVDFDRQFEYSNIVNINRKQITNNDIRFYPNPIQDDLSINYESITNEPVQITILDMIGRVLIVQNKDLTQGDNQLNIDCTNLPQGNYFIQLQSNSTSIIQMIIKQ
ncbi:MAG: family 16 glycosylhydrolase [Saprospiraceae bacterium]